MQANQRCAAAGGASATAKCRWLQMRVADAMVETGPIDARGAPRCISVAQMNAPNREMGSSDVTPGIRHRVQLLSLASLLPLAIDADIESDWIMEGRDGACPSGRRKQSEREQRELPPHRTRTDITGVQGQAEASHKKERRHPKGTAVSPTQPEDLVKASSKRC